MTPERVGDPRFFLNYGPHALAAIAEAAGLEMVGAAASERLFAAVAPLQTAGENDVSFVDNRRYAALLDQTAAGAVILHPSLVDRLRPGCIGLVTKAPYLAWARVAALFFPPPPPCPGRHGAAVIDPTARIDPSAEIGPLVVVGAGAVIGPGCRIGAGSVIGPGVVVGEGCTIGSLCSLSHAVLGARVRLLPGVRIGQDGFGFAPDGAGGYETVPQLGRVVLEHDVEVGANTTIDRGSMHDTVIGAGSRLDNLVQIGHNVRLGRGCVIVAQVGISGSTVLEDHVMVAGQAGLVGHLHIGRQARIGAQAGIMADVAAGESVMGSPSQPVRQYFRELAALRRLAARALAARSGSAAPAAPDHVPD